MSTSAFGPCRCSHDIFRHDDDEGGTHECDYPGCDCQQFAEKERNIMSTKQVIGFFNDLDQDGNPTGGYASGTGISITWQNGPLGRDEERKEPNGAFVEDVLEICAERLRFYQSSKFRSRENALAITKIEEAILWLNKRTQEREARGVEGTHEA